MSVQFFFLRAFGTRWVGFTVVKPRVQGADARVIIIYFHLKNTVRFHQFGGKRLLPLEWTKYSQIHHV